MQFQDTDRECQEIHRAEDCKRNEDTDFEEFSILAFTSEDAELYKASFSVANVD